jgi:hypothetical protein
LEKAQDRQIITNSVFDVAVLDTSDDSDDPAKIAESVKRRQDRAKALKERHRNLAACDEPTSPKEPEDKSEAKNSSKKTIKNKKAQATDRKENKKRNAETKVNSAASAEDDDHDLPPSKKPRQVRGLTTKAGQSEFLERLSEKGLQAKQEELKVSGMLAEAKLAKFGGMTPEQRRFLKDKAAQEERQKNKDRALERAKLDFKTQELQVRQLEAEARIEESKGQTHRDISVFASLVADIHLMTALRHKKNAENDDVSPACDDESSEHESGAGNEKDDQEDSEEDGEEDGEEEGEENSEEDGEEDSEEDGEEDSGLDV